ncbi:MAG: hypothetical protein LBP53_07480 [Candidatus Peribacteria bacterium]|nr:hypothetical protein [Candidatus Peribacteria bacterium]
MTNIIQLEANAYPYPSIPQNSSLYPTKHQIKMRKKQSRADKELAKQEREL